MTFKNPTYTQHHSNNDHLSLTHKKARIFSAIILSSVIAMLSSYNVMASSNQGSDQMNNTETNEHHNKEKINLSGNWVNNRGSKLELKQSADNELTGTFTTAVAKTQACIGYPAPVTGFINDNAIAISINMMGCGSPVVITIAGSYAITDDSKEQINTLGVVQYTGADHWNSRIVSAEYFVRAE